MSQTTSQDKPGIYDFAAIESKWQRYWLENHTFTAVGPGQPGFDPDKPKCYVLDMFPYPSGAGLHVGHPLGYCASDIYARYKRMRGYNVMHPMGFDAFGLPAEQYAIETGVHPAETTTRNLETYRRQLRMFGLSFDWDREVVTCDPSYYQFTQWIFLQLFKSWYDPTVEWTDAQGKQRTGRARPIDELVAELERGPIRVDAAFGLVRNVEAQTPHRVWGDLSVEQQRRVLDGQRLAYLDEVPVNWCPALGTVLANEEVTADGRSERGDHPVYRKPLRQWMLRITAYADRLLADLDEVDWPEPVKLMQRNWIGRSEGAEVDFVVADGGPEADTVGDEQAWRTARQAGGYPALPEAFVIRIYTTRPDTLFGATYMVLAPEHPLVERITTAEQRATVDGYVEEARHRSERDRTADVRSKTGVFTGAHAINPVNGERIPIWVADYVLMGYGTGAIMSVPGHDKRDFEFAKAFGLSIRAVVLPDDSWLSEQLQSDQFDGEYCDRVGKSELVDQIRKSAHGAVGTIYGINANYMQGTLASLINDPSWIGQVAGEAFKTDPGIFVEVFTGEGVAVNSGEFDGLTSMEFTGRIVTWLAERGLGRGSVNTKIRDWVFSRQKYWGEPFPILHGEDGEVIALSEDELPLELPEMPDFKRPVSDDPDVMPEPPLGRAGEWVKVTRDGKSYHRDLNTMPQWAGSCWYYLRYLDPHNKQRICDPEAERYWMPVDMYVGGAEHAVLHLLYARFWHKVLHDLGHVSTSEPFNKLINQGMIQGFAYRDGRGTLVPSDRVEEQADGTFRSRDSGEPVTQIIGKMSKSLGNVVSPDDIVAQYGADAFRMYEMYMGPIEASKPWQTRDVPGLFKLLNRVWRLVVDEQTDSLSPMLCDDEPGDELTRCLHKTIKKIGADVEQFKFNTAIAAMFDFVNTVTPCEKRPRSVIEPFVLLLAPFAPHIAEELWQRLGHDESLAHQPWPEYDEALARDEQVEIAVQINGKLRSRVTVDTDADQAACEAAARADSRIGELIEGQTIRKVIVVPGRLVNIIVG